MIDSGAMAAPGTDSQTSISPDTELDSGYYDKRMFLLRRRSLAYNQVSQ